MKLRLALINFQGVVTVAVCIDKIIYIAIAVYLIDNKRSEDRITYQIWSISYLEVMCHTWIDDCLSIS